MSEPTIAAISMSFAVTGVESTRGGRRRGRSGGGGRGFPAVALLMALILGCALPASAQAHGPIAPAATDYLALVSHSPAGVEAKVIDGYLRLWMRAQPDVEIEVLDYEGAPYLRFSRGGVYVNEHSEMYYLNYFTPRRIPSGLSRDTPPKWERVSSGHEYEWHDGRIGGLAQNAAAPGAYYLGEWRIAVLANGRLSAITGGLWHSGDPSIVWFWPIVVLLACLLAAWRLRSNRLDARILRGLALAALLAAAVGASAKELHGRPEVGAAQIVALGLALAFVVGAFARTALGRQGLILLFAIWILALLVGAELLSTLLHPFVLLALPAFIVRTSAVVCLGCGVSMPFFLLRFPARGG